MVSLTDALHHKTHTNVLLQSVSINLTSANNSYASPGRFADFNHYGVILEKIVVHIHAHVVLFLGMGPMLSWQMVSLADALHVSNINVIPSGQQTDTIRQYKHYPWKAMSLMNKNPLSAHDHQLEKCLTNIGFAHVFTIFLAGKVLVLCMASH